MTAVVHCVTTFVVHFNYLHIAYFLVTSVPQFYQNW